MSISERMKIPKIQTLDQFIKKTYSRRYQSVFTCTVGQNQSGKTDWCLYQMERIHALGLGDAFGANMPLEADFEIDFIEDFQTLEKRCRMLNPDPFKQGIKRYFFFASEMGKWAPQDQPWLNVKFIEELQLVRKYGLSMIADGIDRIDKRILNESHFHGKFTKLSKDHPDKAMYEDWFNGRKVKLFEIPQTKIKFDTWYSARFFMEPQDADTANIPLNPQHEIVRKYLECGSWKKADIHPQEGKRALMAVLDYHMKHCLTANHQIAEEEVSSEASEAHS